MKPFPSLGRLPGFVVACILLTLTVFRVPLGAQETATETAASAADQAWAETEQVLRPPVPPAEWRERRPTPEEVEAFREQQGRLAAAAADRAREFYEQYPGHEQAGTAREKEFELIQIALQLGNTNVVGRLENLEAARLSDPELSEDERFELRAGAVQRAAMARGSEGRDAVMEALESGARELAGEFPDRDEPYQMLLSIAGNADAEQAQAIAREVLEGARSEPIREAAQGMLNRFEALGKPVDIQFTSINGREIDLTQMKGKVVLVDFWATWCGPCIAELPKVKSAYERLHPEGFEIVGISFDQSREKLEALLEKEDMSWPQYFDGKGWDNDIGRRYGISSIPTMWLLDKEGLLVDMNARENLQAKVEKLLAQ